MLSGKNWLLLAGLVLAITPSVTDAQQRDTPQKDCFAVSVANSAKTGNIGSIRVDRCTGDTWVLGRIKLGEGKEAVRWFPISVEKVEYASGGESAAK